MFSQVFKCLLRNLGIFNLLGTIQKKDAKVCKLTLSVSVFKLI